MSEPSNTRATQHNPRVERADLPEVPPRATPFVEHAATVRPEVVVAPRRHRSWSQVWLVLALLLGVAAGIATTYLQGRLPGPTSALANSLAVWSLVAFIVTLLFRQTGGRAALMGAVTMLGEVAGYYAIAAPLRDISATTNERIFWLSAAIVIGPIVGLAAGWWTNGRVIGRLGAAAAMSGIVLGEGVHGLIRVDRTGFPWWTEAVLGAVVGGLAAAHYGRSTFWRAIGIAVTLVIAAAVYGVYGDTVNRILFGV